MSGIDWPDVPQIWRLMDLHLERWEYVYPDLNVQKQCMAMAEWLEANPRRHPRNWKRFMVNWLAKNQAACERVELREYLQREQRHIDSSVGKWEGYK